MGSKKRLGRGLDALLSGGKRPDNDVHAKASVTYPSLSIAEMAPGKYQPRQSINDESLAELVQSIQQQGILQPLLVRTLTGSGAGDKQLKYEIVAGERRWRAAKLAGLKTVPAVVRDLDDKAALAVALIENLQREDLSPIEIAESLQKLTEEFGLTHQEAADTVGRSRSSVSNYLRLLELDSSAREMLAGGQLDMGHARALLPLDKQEQAAVAKRVLKEDLSVRQVESMVAERINPDNPPATKPPTTLDTQTRWLQHQFAQESGMKVGIRTRKNGGRTLGIEFGDLEQLENALLRIEELVRQLRETAGPRVRDAKD